MKFKIGNVVIPNQFILAPMAGVTNVVYRSICKELGAGLVVSEMISDNGLKYNNQKTFDMLKVNDVEHPISLQIFGDNKDDILEGVKKMMEIAEFDIIDINMGCPVNKVFKTGAGSALLKEPEKIYEIIKTLKDNIDKPVTIKMRAGIDHNHINCREVAKLAEKAGVDAIFIHGRTKSDLYNGKCNLDYIKQVKETVSIPVIGNGDIQTVEDAKRMMEYTGCDAVMIGRSALGNPWIFKEMNEYFEHGNIYKPTPNDVLEMIERHAIDLIALKGEKNAMIEMRGHGAWYLKRLVKFQP